MTWFRTCQECGYRQEARNPDTYKGEGWRELKCKRCKSPGLDFGSETDGDFEDEE